MLCVARVVDHQMRLQIDLRTPSRKASCVRFAHHINTGEAACSSGRRYRDHSVQV